MESIKDHLQKLFNKAEWTSEEKQWLLQYLEETQDDELHRVFHEHFQQVRHIDDIGLSNDLLQRIHDRIGIRERPQTAVLAKWGFTKYLVAATVAGLLFLGAYLAFTKKDTSSSTQAVVKKDVFKDDVLPGGNNAILTLADGSTIRLNEGKNGQLAQQGNTTVLKMDGKLTYSPSDSLSTATLYNTITTPRGGQYQIVLADGSTVWLNAESSLRFPASFTGNERRVEVTGEAYFDVARKTDLPFIVVVGSSAVRVLGTQFNVMAYKDEDALQTTLLEGSVKFSNGTQAVTLKPGEQSRIKNDGAIDVVSDVDVDKVVSWKNGYFNFDGESIQTVTKQLSRWYDIEVVISKTVEDRFYAEIPRNTKLSDALRALELTGKVDFEIEGRKVTVKP